MTDSETWNLPPTDTSPEGSTPIVRVARKITWPLVVIVIFTIGFGAFGATEYILHRATISCHRSRDAWDNKHTAWIRLTEPTEFPPTTDQERLGAERAVNDDKAATRKVLIDGLGPRPNC